MGMCGYLAVPGKFLVVLGLKLLFLVPAGVPARSGDSALKDNITVKQGDSAVLNGSLGSWCVSPAVYGRTTPWTGRQSIAGATQTHTQDKQPRTHSFAPKGNLEKPINHVFGL
ncbi:hypothetical protein AMECASPLE_014743 [Ameca splendens]|uniref:Uncharacterized protein n=1 Tax=Ameca splendens TaxID=208324 RepID=A0ABV0ZXG9_9TELE